MEKIKVLVFDFDGTIVDSNAIKHDAYFYLFPEFVSPQEKEIIAANISRKPRWGVIKDILNALGQKEELAPILAKKYGEIVESEIVNGNGIPGAFKTLWELSKKYKIYINSGTPTAPLKKIVQKLAELGKIPVPAGVMGREEDNETSSKIKNLKEIKKIENITKKKMVMIGDGIPDKESAEIFGCKFIHISEFLKGGLNDQKS